jgi:hypothetical protein
VAIRDTQDVLIVEQPNPYTSGIFDTQDVLIIEAPINAFPLSGVQQISFVAT